ncbi:thioesterase [Kineosporia sp. J2-2]|uniref:Thioesterase n=1 Tax=Kineosporia corallincola TaxID=2835133 RepID=A0ABS5TPD0_9ACTN|nr:alpha/beta fold hydrolase [Kineosporia corallincola]MBT0772972.1 thioesterase [Kineosporia corallincola]
MLVVLPHAGGSASRYRSLFALLAGEIEVLAVQYPGRQDRLGERPVTDLVLLAEQVAASLEPLNGRTVMVFGHSMGALVAFEVARIRQYQRQPVAALTVSARRAPGLAPEPLPDLDDEGLLAETRALGGTDERLLLDEELIDLYLPVLRADYLAVQAYRCDEGAAIDAPIMALSGASDPAAPPGDAAAWRQHTRGRFGMKVFPGGHFYFDEHCEEVSRVVASALNLTRDQFSLGQR